VFGEGEGRAGNLKMLVPVSERAFANLCEFARWGGALWISSLDGQPAASSRRLLLVHLTDLQNSGARFGDRARWVLEAWGDLPHLVRRSTAAVSLASEHASELHVWALDVSGRRIARLESAEEDGALVVKTDTRGPRGACLYYEIAAE